MEHLLGLGPDEDRCVGCVCTPLYPFQASLAQLLIPSQACRLSLPVLSVAIGTKCSVVRRSWGWFLVE